MTARANPRPPPRPERTETLRLADGRELWIRPVQPDDAGPIAGGFELLGEDEIRRRYLHPVKELAADYLAQLVHPLPGEAFAVVAAEPAPPGEALVGALARINRDPGTDSAEFAILVSHFIAGQGVGHALMLRLFEWARANGIRRIWGDVLEENTTMIQLAQALGFEREAGAEDPGVVRVAVRLEAPTRRRKH